MTPPPAATVAGRRPASTGRRAPAPRVAARGRRSLAVPAAAALPRSAALRLPRLSLRALPVPLLRLLNGRGAIVVLGTALLGLVFLQVSLLKLNTAISVNVERASDLERSNAQARATVSKLDAGRRIQDAAGQLGMVMPAAGAICFLDAKRSHACSGGDAAQAGKGLDPAADLAPLVGAAVAVVGTDGSASQQAPAQVAPAGQPAPDTTVQAQTVTAPPGNAQAPAQQGAVPAPAQGGATAPAATQAPATATPAPVNVVGGTGGQPASTGTGG